MVKVRNFKNRGAAMTDVSDDAFTGIDMQELMEIMDNDLVLMNEL